MDQISKFINHGRHEMGLLTNKHKINPTNKVKYVINMFTAAVGVSSVIATEITANNSSQINFLIIIPTIISIVILVRQDTKQFMRQIIN